MFGCLRRLRSTRGSSPLEVMVTAVSASMLFAGLYGFYRAQLFALRGEEVAVEAKEEADVALDFIMKEVRLAGARPAPRLAGCSVPVAPLAACTDFESIPVANATQITIQYDFHDGAGGEGDGCPNDAMERLTYAYNAESRTIERTAQGINGDQPVVLAENVPEGGFAFEYHDRNGAILPIEPGGLTDDQRNAVSRVVVTITSRAEHPDPGIAGPIETTRSSMVFLRNPGC